MTFQAYIDNVQQKTGKTPDDFHALAKEQGLLRADIKAMEFVGWLKREFGLGHGHAMAIWSAFQRNGWVAATPAKSARARRGPKT